MNLRYRTILLLLSLCLSLMGIFVDEVFTVIATPSFMLYYILKIEEMG